MNWTPLLLLSPVVLAGCPGEPMASTDTDPSTTRGSTTTMVATETAPTTTGPGTETGPAPTTSTTGEHTTAVDPTPGDPTVEPTTVDPTTLDTTTTTSSTTTSSSTTTTSTTDATSTTDTGVVGECVPGDIQSCYGGPDGTLDVGECVAGQQECGRDELWGPCVGEVVPAPDTCDQPGDESCDGLDPCQGDGEYAWGLTFGKTGDDHGERVAFDGAGNVVVAAFGNGDIDFGGGLLVHAGYDIFLAKFAPDGALLWSERFGDGEFQGGPEFGLAIADDGDIVLSGVFHGDLDFGGGPLSNPTPQTALFLARLDGDGGHVWSESFPSGEDAATIDLALDPGGDILLTGVFTPSLDLGGAPLVSAGGYDLFVARFTGAGEHVWSRGFGGPDWQVGLGIAPDPAGDIYVTGGLRGSFDPGTGPLTSAGIEDIFLLKLDPDGLALWGKRWGDAGSQGVGGLAVDSKGRVTLTGATSGVLDFGGGPIEGVNVVSWLAQFDGSGAHLWSRELCEGGSLAEQVAVDGLDNLVAAGIFHGTCDLGSGPMTAIESRDVFVAKFSPTGLPVWGKRLGGPQEQHAGHVAASAAGPVAAVGDFYSAIDLGAGAKTSQGGRDGFIAVFAP
ncbi:hypothetical protein SAMN02745121_09035 [Nannocystis exedens]|uniref:Delta-60 repeat domain-containing protein n=1 Tax=Nannocystis exedens TaxID=54 RepID=A0A1I2IY52_9BACT|nr:hypothetical protein [Nannocystis exedens]PCC67177.1 hypothetical protein NAEX_00180 [Nannocystis exedens]SFF46533.1 hypothetical protein SAMN02745121_09035 [Nannocystis exedens]